MKAQTKALESTQVPVAPLSFPTHSTAWPHAPLSRAYAQGVAYIEDKYLPVADARIPLLDWGFTRSDACQDTISIWDGKIFRLEDHLERFERSWKQLRLSCPLSREEVRDVVHKLVMVGGFRDAYVQLIMTRGTPPIGSRDPRQCTNRFQAYAIPYVWIASPEKQQEGVRVHVSDIRRIPSQSVSPLIKHYHWLDFEMGLFEALDRNADTVVLKNMEGNIAEGPGFNLFAVHEGRLLTPITSTLDGMTRRTVIEIASELEIPWMETDVSPEILTSSTEVFLTTTAGGIIPVSTVDAFEISPGPGPVTRRLHGEYWSRRDAGWKSTNTRFY